MRHAFSLALAPPAPWLFLGRRTAWMLGSTPPWAMVTPAMSLFSSSSFLVAVWLQQELLTVEQVDFNDSALPSLESLVSELSTVEEEVAIVGHVEVIIGHGNLTPSCLTRGSTGSLQFTGLEHCGPAWQPLEIATLFLSLAGLHRLEVVMAAD